MACNSSSSCNKNVNDSSKNESKNETEKTGVVNIPAKLYYTKGSCSSAVFITAFQLGLRMEVESVDLATHRTASGVDFYTINPKGNVPALVFVHGVILNETAAIMQYLADQYYARNNESHSNTRLLPSVGHLERYQVLNELNFVATELHQTIGKLWHKSTEELRQTNLINSFLKLNILEKKLQNVNYLTNNQYSLADTYAYVVLSWCKHVGLELINYPNILAYSKRISELEHVQKAQEHITLIPTHSC